MPKPFSLHSSFVVAALVLAGGTAAAQAPAPAGTPPPANPPPAPSDAPQASPAPATDAKPVQVSEEARRRFSTGVALLKDPKEPRYEEAYREFKAAYAASPSYKILGNLGLCAMMLERDGEAIEAYERYLREGALDLTTAERDQFQRDLMTLKAGFVAVTLTSEPKGATIVDERLPVQGVPVRNIYGPTSGELKIGVRRGHHVVTAKLDGYVDARWELDAQGGEAQSHAFVLEPVGAREAPRPEVVRERPIPITVYVAGGVTAALAIAGSATGMVALSTKNNFDRANDGLHPDEAAQERSRGKTLNVVTDVLFVGALLGAGATAYFLFTRPTVERTAQGSQGVSVRPTVGVAPGGGAAGLIGTF
jgi:hypothetical protein